MTFAPSRTVGGVLAVLGLLAFCLGASATMGVLSDLTAAPSSAPSVPPQADRAPGPEANVHASVGALAVDRHLPLPAAAPLPVKYERSVEATHTPIPISARVDVQNGAGAGDAPDGARLERASTVSQRLVLSSPDAAMTAGATIATTAGLLIYFWSAVKAWAARALALPVVTLYAKVARAELFDNAVRERIFAVIREHAGRSASELAKSAGVSWGTTIYHLDVLEHNRMVTSLRQGRHRRYFENGAVLPGSKETVSVLQNAVTALVARRVQDTPGVTQKDLAASLAMTPQALHWHLVRLQSVGVIHKRREGRVVRHFAAAEGGSA